MAQKITKSWKILGHGKNIHFFSTFCVLLGVLFQLCCMGNCGVFFQLSIFVLRVCVRACFFLFTLGLHAAIWTSALFRSKRLERAAYSFKLRWVVRGARRGSPVHVHAHSCQDLRRPLHVRAEIGRSLRGPLRLLAG